MLPFVVFGESLTLAALNMTRHQLRGVRGISVGNGFEDSMMILMDLGEQRRIMAIAVDREDSHEQARFVYRLQNPRISGHAKDQSMKAEIASDEAAHLLLVESSIGRFRQVIFYPKDFIGEALQPLEVLRTVGLARHFADRVDFQRLTHLVQVDDVL